MQTFAGLYVKNGINLACFFKQYLKRTLIGSWLPKTFAFTKGLHDDMGKQMLYFTESIDGEHRVEHAKCLFMLKCYTVPCHISRGISFKNVVLTCAR